MNDLVSNELYHHGILGMKWGVRRYQNPDGTLTEAGKKRYLNNYSLSEAGRKKYIPEAEQIAKNVYSKHIKSEEDLEKAKEQYKEWDKAYERRYWNLDPNKADQLRMAVEQLEEKSLTTKIYEDTFDELKKNNPSLNDMIISELAGIASDDILAATVYDPVLTEKRRDKKTYWVGEEDPEKLYFEAKHSDEDSNELYHWGILGMKWGVRRYQNKDGSLTSAGRSRYGSGKKKVGILEAHRIKKRKAEAAKKRAETLAKRKAEEEDAQKHEAEKQEAIRSGNATQIAKFQNELSNQELRDVLARLDSKQKLSELVAKETPKKETKLDKAMKIAEKGAKYAEVAEKGIKVYNTFAKVSNAFADDNNQLPIIGEKREKKAPKNEAKEAAIRSGDAKEIAKWKGKLTPEETKTAMLTLDYWDKIKEKSVSSTVKEQREGQKAAAKELAENLSTHSDEYNEAVKRARDLDYHIKEQDRAERKQRIDDAKTALKDMVNPSERTKTIREYSNAEIGSKEVIDRILKDLEKK